MPIYRFEARDSSGFEVEDSIEALSEEEARQMIEQMGYFVTKITEVADGSLEDESTPEPDVGSSAEFELTLEDSDIELTPREGDSQLKPEDIFETDSEVPALDGSGPAPGAHSANRKIGEVLIELGYLDEDQLREVLDEAEKTGQFTGHVALSRGLITEDQLAACYLAAQDDLGVISLDDVEPTAEVLRFVPETIASDYKFLPLSYRDGILTVVSSDPGNPAMLDDLRNSLGCKEVRVLIASPEAIADARARAYAGKEGSILDLIRQLESDKELCSRVGGWGENSIDLESLMEIQDAAPVRKLVNMVMLLAIKDHASDIHFEPFEEEYKMRYRCDGVLYEMVPPPRHLGTEIADRIKVMANLDTAERRLPQYGRIELNIGGNPVSLRVSVLPTMFGESVFIRVLDPTVLRLDLSRVGMDPALLAQFREIVRHSDGVVLVTGPPGAGKTTTLYSALNELNEIADKIITAEDPVEYDIDGIVHCRIHDLTSANTLRSILGQAPDIIVVGEIRDPETAGIAVQAALSGRLVLSTLDANDASWSITRLRGMGLEPTLIAATVKAILAQRLVRKICEDCRTEFEPGQDQLMELNLRPQDVKGKKIYYGRGCDRCNNTGHRGRCGIFELVVMNDEISDLISAGASTDQLRARCRAQGMTTLREAGMKALYDGVTTIDEVVGETVLLG